MSEPTDASTAEVEATLRSDFILMTPCAQGRMLDLLKTADPNKYDWWVAILVGMEPKSQITQVLKDE